MASYRVRILPSAERELIEVAFPFRRQLNQRIMSLKAAPRRTDVRIVSGEILLTEVSRWRLIYEVDDGAQTVTVLAVLPPVA
jgi:mRNA-degrading endonuclease RelE of RelBE toxin-antitoxin system